MRTPLGFPPKTGSHNSAAVEVVLPVVFGCLCHMGGTFLEREHGNFYLPAFGNQCCGNMEDDGANTENSVKLHSALPPSIINSFISCSNERINVS